MEGACALIGAIASAALRMWRSRARLPKKEKIMPRSQIAATTPAVASRVRFRRLARELLPLAPSAARSCRMTWLKIWLRNSHCVTFLDSAACTFCVAPCQSCVDVFEKSSVRMMEVAFEEKPRAGVIDVFEAITVPPRG